MKPVSTSNALPMARVHLIHLAINHDVRITLRQDAGADWVAMARHNGNEHWRATAPDPLSAAIQLERLLIGSQRCT